MSDLKFAHRFYICLCHRIRTGLQLFLGLSFVTLSACATAPETAAPVADVPVTRPAPVAIRPAPVPPVTSARIEQDVKGPVPGSLEDFINKAQADRVYFDYDSYDLSRQARSVLKRQADWLRSYPAVNVLVSGHADERGTREYNLALGARRADSVKAYLVNLGIDPRRLTTVSFGKERPIDGRSNEAGWARNRNSHTRIVSGAIG